MRRAGEVQQRCGKIQQFHQRIALFVLLEMAGPAENERHTHEALVKTAAFVHQAVVAEGFAVVAGENDYRVLALTGGLQRGKDARELVINLRNHRVVPRLCARLEISG